MGYLAVTGRRPSSSRRCATLRSSPYQSSNSQERTLESAASTANPSSPTFPNLRHGPSAHHHYFTFSPSPRNYRYPSRFLYVLVPWFGFIIYRTTLKLVFATSLPTSILRSCSSNSLLFFIEFLQGTPCIQYEKFNALCTI